MSGHMWRVGLCEHAHARTRCSVTHEYSEIIRDQVCIYWYNYIVRRWIQENLPVFESYE